MAVASNGDAHNKPLKKTDACHIIDELLAFKQKRKEEKSTRERGSSSARK